MSYFYLKLADLKNRARRIAREEGLPRQHAHDIAAMRGGFQNYAHALQLLPDGDAPARVLIELRQRWREREPRRWGDANFSVALASPLEALLRPNHLVEYLGGCEITGSQILVSDGGTRDVEETRIDLGKIARALQFIDATGLKPSRAKRIYPKGSWYDRPPIADHDHGWYDPETRTHVLSTEPYRDDAATLPEQQAWGEKWGWATLPVAWGSIYGFGTTLYLMCPMAYLPVLREKVARLEAGPVAVDTEAILIADPLARAVE